MSKKISQKLRSLGSGIFTSIRKLRSGSDYNRWTPQDSLSQSWDLRTQQIAGLIDPGTRLIEFGAGRLVLKNFLPQDCIYTPSDLVDRGHGTIVCDLNAEQLPDLPSYDIAVFSGVLEYVNDVPRLLLHLSKHVDGIIASYADVDLNKRNRRKKGWVNDYTSSEFIELFAHAGFQCAQMEQWKTQLIYKFSKKPNPSS